MPHGSPALSNVCNQVDCLERVHSFAARIAQMYRLVMPGAPVYGISAREEGTGFAGDCVGLSARVKCSTDPLFGGSVCEARDDDVDDDDVCVRLKANASARLCMAWTKAPPLPTDPAHVLVLQPTRPIDVASWSLVGGHVLYGIPAGFADLWDMNGYVRLVR